MPFPPAGLLASMYVGVIPEYGQIPTDFRRS